MGLLCLAVSAAAKEKPFRAPRLQDGTPNMQGMWEMSNLTQLERPPGFKSLIISAAEAVELKKQLDTQLYDGSKPNDPPGFDDDRKFEAVRGELRSSIIVDPTDGALPSNAQFKARAKSAFERLSSADGPEQRLLTERCLAAPSAIAPFMPMPANNLHQIIQTPTAIVIVSEFNHDARIIKIGAVHGPEKLTSWLGDSIGHWEGETLVVETRYFTPADSMRMAPFFMFFISPQAVVVERFKMISDKEISYEFTVEDPVYYTRRWAGENHFLRTDEQMFEFACHEGNYALVGVLQGARARDGVQGN